MDEETRILAVLQARQDERTFFVLALESAMRMRECYTLELSQVALSKKTIHLDRTKNGDSRQVPLTTPAQEVLRSYINVHEQEIKGRAGRLFPFWDGDLSVAALDKATRELSRVFSLIFDAAQAGDLHFHDLRHEATCRLYKRTTLSDVLVAKITSHRDLRTLKRYASLRGSDLAPRLW